MSLSLDAYRPGPRGQPVTLTAGLRQLNARRHPDRHVGRPHGHGQYQRSPRRRDRGVRSARISRRPTPARRWFNYAGSSTLAQINQGVPADVFASAAPANMKTVTDAGNGAGTPVTFVKNQLVIAVPKGNPKAIKGLSDLTKPGVKVALCDDPVPCGAAAKKALTAANVSLTPVTKETDVKAAWLVKLGEVDAALVYRTDAKSAAADVDGIEFPSRPAPNGTRSSRSRARPSRPARTRSSST
jgi:molybdenum ABC transporter molybdate-binding protein